MPLALRLALAVTALGFALAAGGARAGDEQDLVDKARITIESFTRQADMAAMREWLGRARGVFIAPQMIKAGFIIGGEGGSGVLLARDADTGAWSPPAFHTLGAGSIGLQAGGEVSELVLVIMTQRGLEAILRNEFKAGADASIAIGPIGKGVAAGTTTSLGADIYSFSRGQGFFGGLSLEGAIVRARNAWNEAYYGKPIASRDIVAGKVVDARGSDALRLALKSAEVK